ncbi:anti-sigma E factor RseA [Mycobacterium cookii]|uniref:Anti-sigma-E factor RseA n=1 Tax=Mycobacterium cookii TaxID=1775 RepID=A0A7I7KUQ7_9MYCO|nr:anti-sigma E factor RseA [Mycobacterium cookii]BBX45845.1 anti-sigma-E factor RseA [Mycobacterium cookii]
MAERGHVFRRAFSWLPAQFASQSDAPVGAPRQFGSTEHLSTEAIAAFVDGELRMNAHLRAAHHISLCPDCAAEVEGHRRARAALRDSHPIRIPSSLLGLLSQIPHCPPDDDAGGQQRGQWGPPRGRGHGAPPPERRARPSDRFADGNPRDHPEPR